MFDKFNKLFENKDKIKSDLLDYKTDIYVSIYDAVLNHKKLADTKLKHQWKNIETKKIDKYKKVVFNFVKRKASASGGAFFWLNKGFISQKFDKLINEQLKNYENKTKIHIISSLGAEFALISRHDDSAKDHKAYQGQLYVKQIALSDPDIREFCDKKGIKTFEWVINGPVYMITRPNCRHYFQEITFEEAKENSVQNLLAKYNMSRKIGQRGMKQTLSSRKKSAVQMIKEYEKRLDLHKKLLEVDYNNQDIKDAIKKDKLLLQKWKTVI